MAVRRGRVTARVDWKRHPWRPKPSCIERTGNCEHTDSFSSLSLSIAILKLIQLRGLLGCTNHILDKQTETFPQ